MPQSLIRLVPHALIATIMIVALAAAAGVASAVPLAGDGQEFNSPGFVVRHAWVKFAWLAARPFRDRMSPAGEDAAVARFFQLNAQIGVEERTAGDPAAAPGDVAAARVALVVLHGERASLENPVERVLEGRLTALLEDVGLTRRIGSDVVWPPVTIEFEGTPSLLVTSPRDAIERHDGALLHGDLPVDRIQRIESGEEADGRTSALVVPLGAIAMYPALVPPSGDYRDALENIAHEWMHHYLYFAPLGRRYYDNGDLRTLNETVANIAGRELGDMLAARYPLPAAPLPSSPSTDVPPVDFAREMHDLRLRVDTLLASGDVAGAERLMEGTRRSLADRGVYIRRINQAYFAFHGTYADTPASSDPIGPKLARLRERFASIEDFVETVRKITSQDALDRLLADSP